MLRQSLSLLSAAFLLFCSAFSPAQATQEEADFFRHAAEQYILAQFANLPPDETVVVTAGKVDAGRDFGGTCPGYLTAELAGNAIRENNSVKLVCSDPQNPFTLYVPVKAEKYISAITAARDLNRGTLLSKSDLNSTFIKDERQNSFGITREDLLIGSKLKRDVREGSVFMPEALCVVCKGDRVTLKAHKGGLSLKTTGIAMEDGNLHDSIKVQNERSKKTVIGRVSDHDTVVIDF